MRVGLDYLPAVSHAPGVGRYARELVRALVRLDEPPELALCELGRAPRAIGEPHLGLAGATRVRRRLRARVPRRWLALAHRLGGPGVDRLLGGVELFHHVLPGALPVTRARRTLALSELPPEGGAAEARLRALARELDGLVVFSADLAARAAARLELPPERVHRAPVGCEHWTRLAPPRARADAPTTVLCLGALSRAHRPLAVLRAFEHVRAGGLDARLVWAGRDGDEGAAFRARLAASPAAPAVEWRRDPTEPELARLAAGCAALVHVPRAAGTPVTPLEACAGGAAVLATRLPAFEEALGAAADWVDPALPDEDPRALGDALAATLAGAADPAGRAARRALAARFPWAGCAAAHRDAWAAVLAAGA